VWDLSRLDVPPGVLPPLPCNAAQAGQHAAYKLQPDCPGGGSPAPAWAGSPPPQQQAQGAGGGAAVAAASWPSPSDPPRRQRHAAGRGGSSGTNGSAASGSSAAAASLDALAATNDCHLRRGVQMGCAGSSAAAALRAPGTPLLQVWLLQGRAPLPSLWTLPIGLPCGHCLAPSSP
jgi:hypothetical protein